jgi:hypothetical protein
MVITDGYVELNSVDLSTDVRSVELTFEGDEVEDSTMGNDGFKSSDVGLLSGSVNLTFKQNYNAGRVDATLWPLVSTRADIPFVIRPTSDAASATNPEYSGTAKCFGYTPLTGGVGALNETTVPLKVQGAITRDDGS